MVTVGFMTHERYYMADDESLPEDYEHLPSEYKHITGKMVVKKRKEGETDADKNRG